MYPRPVPAVAVLEREGGGGQYVYRICHHLPPNCCSLFKFVVDQIGETDLPLLVEGLDSSICCQKPLKGGGRARDALVADAQACVEIETFLTSLG